MGVLKTVVTINVFLGHKEGTLPSCGHQGRLPGRGGEVLKIIER